MKLIQIWMKNMKKIIGMILLTTMFGSNTVQANESNYGFCFSIAKNQDLFISEIFPVSSKIASASDAIAFKQTRAEKKFESHIRIYFDDSIIVSSWCDFKYSSYQKAEDAHTDRISRMKDENYSVRSVSWSYSDN
jgi:hypothetical protein